MTVLYVGNILSKYGKTPTNIETLGPQLESLGYEVIYASDKRWKLTRLIHMVYLLLQRRAVIHRVLIDVYSTQSFWYAVVVGKLCRLLSLPYFTILHGGNLPERLEQNPHICKKLFGGAASIIAPSPYLKVKFEAKGFVVNHLPNNIPISGYDFQKRTEINCRLLYVRSFDEVYNPQMAIDVLAKLKHSFPDATLCMVGPDKDGSLKRCVDKAENLGLTDSVEFPGRLSKAEWHKLSRNFDIFINTTNFDNTPVSVIEAMALGLPVVSTNVGGIPYMLNNENDSLLVGKGDLDGMVEAVKRLVKDSVLTERLVVNARKKAEEYDWNVVSKKWVKILG